MKMKNKQEYKYEVKQARESGICMTLFLVFLILKLTNVITWSWWLVTLPLWAPLALGLVLFIVLSIIFMFNS